MPFKKLLKSFCHFDGALALITLLLLSVFFLHAKRSGFWPIKNHLLLGENLAGRLSRQVDPSIPILSPWGYDSQFFWAMAQDPFMKNPQVLEAIDSPSYRYQRIFLPLITWLTPGSVQLLPYRLWVVNAAGWILGFVAMIFIARILKVRPSILAAAYVLNGGMLFSWFHPMADLWAATLALWGLYFCLQEKWEITALFWALATLTKETTALLPAAVVLFFLTQKKVFTRANVWMVLCVLPAILWQGVIFSKLGTWPVQQSIGNFDLPYLGAWKGLHNALLRSDDLSVKVCWMSVLFLVGNLFSLGRPRNVLQMLLWVQVAFLSFAGVAIMEGVGSVCRAFLLAAFLGSIYIAQKFSDRLEQLE